jgi:hypothetical protein
VFELNRNKELFEIIPKEKIREVFNKLGQRLIFLHQKRMKNQIEIDGSSYPALKQSTIEQKRRAGGSSARNAEKRMLRTEDFRKHAYEYFIRDNSLIFTISNKVHKFQKIYNEQLAWKTREENSKNGKKPTNKKPKPTFRNKNGSYVTYKDIAKYQLRGKFNSGWRSPYNAGASFFGLTDPEVADAIKFVRNNLIKIAKENISNDIKKTIANAKLR